MHIKNYISVENRDDDKTKTRNKTGFLTAITAVCAGIVNGLMGTGGGIVLVIALEAMYDKTDGGDNFKKVITSTLLAVLAMSAVSAAIYLKRGSFSFGETLPYLPASAVGGAVGGIILSRIKSGVLRKIFAALVIFFGVRMIIG